jgi:hypothetical protein
VACGRAGDAAAPAGVDASATPDANGSSGNVDGSTGDASTSSSGDGGDGGGDAGSDAGTTSSSGNAFTDAPPYTPMLGVSSLKAEHQAAFGTMDPSKHDCSECHLFAAAGSVFTDATGTTPVAMAEVRLRTASTGKAVSVYTDENGNFIMEQSTAFLAGLKFPFQGGVRTDAGIALMTGTQNDGSCNLAACHGGAQGWVHGP